MWDAGKPPGIHGYESEGGRVHVVRALMTSVVSWPCARFADGVRESLLVGGIRRVKTAAALSVMGGRV